MVIIVKMQLILLEIIKLEHFCTISILVKEVSTGEELFEGTSKGFGAEWVFEKAKTDGMNISNHVQDDDSTSSKALRSHFPECMIMLCSGHIARNHEKQLKRFAKQKTLI